jgi:hypothetical protein
METRRWTNPSHPQTLPIAVFLLYAEAVIRLLFGAVPFVRYPGLYVAAALVGAVGGYGIANSRRWGYQLAVAATSIQMLLLVVVPLIEFQLEPLGSLEYLIAIVFPVAMFCALIHPQSREHQRIWFD